MLYCHDCAEMQLKHAFALKNIKYPLVSDPKNEVFKVIADDSNTYVINVRSLELEHVGVCVTTCQDWNIFINLIDEQLKSPK